MTQEEILDALLTTGAVDTNGVGGDPIVLSGPRSRRLAQIVIDHLRSSSVRDLSNDQGFFESLEEAFCEADGDIEAPTLESDEKGTQVASADKRSWRLKRVVTRGFGGLNARAGDIFEFDAASQDYCIEGQNGSGKSSLANAVLFTMTGKVHRDQYASWDDPTRSEPVVSAAGASLGTWPPIATYPESWGSENQTVDVSVTLTFGNETDDEEIEATRRLRGEPGALQLNVSIDPRLTAQPTLIEAALVMPMRIQHIRVPIADDNRQLVGLIRQLIGLEPVLDVANLVDKLSHRNQRFLKYASDNDAQGKATSISKLLGEAQEAIKNLDLDIDLTVIVEANKPIPDDRLKELDEATAVLNRQQAEGFQQLAALSFNGFDPNNVNHRQRVIDTINELCLDASRQLDPRNLPPVLTAISDLAKTAGEENLTALRSVLRKALSDLGVSINWAHRQEKDTLLRLKAVAAEHFEDCEDPLCPLCEQSLGGTLHQGLVEDLRILKTDVETAQARLDDACRRIEQEVMAAAKCAIPDELTQVGRFAVKRNALHHVQSAFVDAEHVAVTMPGFADISKEAVDAAFEAVEEFEFGAQLPEPQNGDCVARVRRLLDHLENTVNAAENWQHARQDFRKAWKCLFSTSDERSLTKRVLELKSVIEGMEPFQSASENVERALGMAAKYNVIVKRQALREEIAQALKPLRELRGLVNRTTSRTINEVSDSAMEIHGQIYNPEALTYEKAEVREFRGDQSITFQAKLSNDLDWRIDASLLANVSWMRGVLWSFVFAIRERAIEQAGYCPFEPMVLDDPQMTFDTRNLQGWVRFLGSSQELRRRQPCQLLVTTHSMPFALEMTAMPDIRMAEIETGQPWSNPTQVVTDDFAAVRFERMVAENSDDRARSLIADIRVLAETMLKHAIEPFDPTVVRQPTATLGRVVDMISQRNATGQPPYADRVFGELISVKSSNPDRFRQLSEPHHSLSETITVREARQVYRFWRETLFPAVRKAWVEYRFLQKSIVGEVAAISLPPNCTHKPPRSTALASVQPSILGRVSAYSDGRAAAAIRIDRLSANGDSVDLSARAAYLLEKDTLSPVARVGDILLTRLDGQCRSSNLVVEDRGTHRVARRWVEDAGAPALAVLVASSSNPRDVPAAIISRAQGANRRKIVGVLFAADQLQPGGMVDPKTEATDLATNSTLVADLVARTDVFEVQGSSAEPIALDKQYLLAKPQKTDLGAALRELDGRPVIAEDSEDCAFFKRLRMLDSRLVILESLDKSGSEGPICLSTDPKTPGPFLSRIREVVGVMFDKS